MSPVCCAACNLPEGTGLPCGDGTGEWKGGRIGFAVGCFPKCVCVSVCVSFLQHQNQELEVC